MGLPDRDQSAAEAVEVRTPAKINLFLAVRDRRPDGMHEIVSVMQTIGVWDHVRVRVGGAAGAGYHPSVRRFMDVRLDLDGRPVPGLPTDDTNLAVRAARALAVQIGCEFPIEDGAPPEDGPVTYLEIDKAIPVAAGMGGGSADAAATLVALNHLWDCELSSRQLREVAATLGADVPFCVTGGTALATGVGDTTAQVLCRGTYHWVVGMAAEPLSTAEVYRAWDEVGSPSLVEPDAVLHALRTDDVEVLGASLFNQLEDAAFALRPALRDARDAFVAAGALGAVVSGSGPTVLGLAASEQHARELAAKVGACFARVEVARSPVGGPELMTSRGTGAH